MQKKILVLCLVYTLSLLQFLTNAEINNFVSDATRTNRKNVMSGLTFRVPAYDTAPFFTIKKNPINGNFSYEGSAPEYLKMIADYFNFKITYVHVNRSEVEHFGSATTIFRMLIDNEVDMTSIPFERKLVYSERADLLYPFWVADYALLQPWPEEESRLTIPIRPFHPTVWMAFIGSTVIFIVFASMLYISSGKENDQKRIKDTILDQLQYVLSIFTLQGVSPSRYHPSNRVSLRILVGSWLLAMVVLVYAYQGVLMSILSVPKLKPTVDNWEQLVAQQEFKLTIEMNSTLNQLFSMATSGIYKQIKDNLDPNFISYRSFKCIDNVLSHNCIYPAAIEMVNYIIFNDFKTNNHQCRLTSASKGLMYYMSFHIAVAKHSPYTEIINHDFMLYFVETGLTNYIRSITTVSDRPCQADAKPKGKMSAFKLKDLTPAFFFYGIGCGLSLLLFLMELIISAGSARKKLEKKSTPMLCK